MTGNSEYLSPYLHEELFGDEVAGTSPARDPSDAGYLPKSPYHEAIEHGQARTAWETLADIDDFGELTDAEDEASLSEEWEETLYEEYLDEFEGDDDEEVTDADYHTLELDSFELFEGIASDEEEEYDGDDFALEYYDDQQAAFDEDEIEFKPELENDEFGLIEEVWAWEADTRDEDEMGLDFEDDDMEIVSEFDFEDEYETVIRSVTFPSGVSLAVVEGAEGRGQAYYDPNRSGNPLLDTSGLNRNKRLSRNFTVDEFARSGRRSFDRARIDPKLVQCLQALRDHLGKPIKITSGFRSYQYNQQLWKACEARKKRGQKCTVGRKSQHLSGRAVDIKVVGMTGLDLAKAAVDACGCDVSIGVGATYIHLDVRPIPKGKPAHFWGYGKKRGQLEAAIRQYHRARCSRNQGVVGKRAVTHGKQLSPLAKTAQNRRNTTVARNQSRGLPTKISRPQDVKYLAFEGGGGKGVTYQGAITAFQDLHVLPIDYIKVSTTSGVEFVVTDGAINRRSGQILGISGSSAGALTALLLVLGHTADSFGKLLSRPTDFERFYDGPDRGRIRAVVNNMPKATNVPNLGNKKNKQLIDKILRKPFEAVARFLPLGTKNMFIDLRWSLLKVLAKWAFDWDEVSFSKQLTKYPVDYLLNLIFDRGLFPGFALRDYIQRQLALFLGQLPQSVRPRDPRLASQTFSFKQLYDVTQVDLVVTGTNITTQRPAYFSVTQTPDFPVAEAVAISMSFPLLFKPILVKSSNHKHLNGYWLDGGVLNNLPIHAFDIGANSPLNREVLALRLTEDKPDENKQTKWYYEIASHIGDLANTFMYPMEEGQLRIPAEANQTINLNTYKLKTTDFAPSAKDRDLPIKEAEKAVKRYFGR